MLAPMPSSSGVRYELKRMTDQNERVEYALSVEVPDECFVGTAEIGVANGAVAFTWSGAEAPAWVQDSVRAQLRTLYREALTGKPYPRRVTRWREEK